MRTYKYNYIENIIVLNMLQMCRNMYTLIYNKYIKHVNVQRVINYSEVVIKYIKILDEQQHAMCGQCYKCLATIIISRYISLWYKNVLLKILFIQM